jgi:hypothetical protein
MRARIFANLFQMIPHCRTRRFRVTLLDSRQNSCVMVLPAFRAAFLKEDFDSLFAQQPNDRIK